MSVHLLPVPRGEIRPRLRPGNIVGYVTCKGRWGGLPDRHHRLTAVLEVAAVLPSHEEAAGWYRTHDLPLPSNCMVPKNPPKPLGQSHAKHSGGGSCGTARLARLWDEEYQRRATLYPVFVICHQLFLDLSWDAPVVEDEDLHRAFGQIPGTQNPGAVGREFPATLGDGRSRADQATGSWKGDEGEQPEGRKGQGQGQVG